jgi:hypothetical protein
MWYIDAAVSGCVLRNFHAWLMLLRLEASVAGDSLGIWSELPELVCLLAFSSWVV